MVRSNLNESEKYFEAKGSGDSSGVWIEDAAAGPSGLFGRTVNHVLVPYILAIRAEGFGFDDARWQQVNRATREQRRVLEGKVAAAEAVNRHDQTWKTRADYRILFAAPIIKAFI